MTFNYVTLMFMGFRYLTYLHKEIEVNGQIKVDQKVLLSLEQKLGTTPVQRAISLWQLMLSMREAMQKAREAGKTVEQMHADLTACGVQANWGTFKKYASDLLSDTPPAHRAAKASKRLASPKKQALGSTTNQSQPIDQASPVGLRNLRSSTKSSGFTPK